MMKTIARLFAAATLCALPAAAQATVTYQVTSALSDIDISIRFATAQPITTFYQITDFTGQRCSILGRTCTSLMIDPTVPGFYDTDIFIDHPGGGFGDGFSGQPLSNNGTYTNTYFTLTVSGIGAVPEPAAWALMLTGFGLTGAALRRRRVRFAGVPA